MDVYYGAGQLIQHDCFIIIFLGPVSENFYTVWVKSTRRHLALIGSRHLFVFAIAGTGEPHQHMSQVFSRA